MGEVYGNLFHTTAAAKRCKSNLFSKCKNYPQFLWWDKLLETVSREFVSSLFFVPMAAVPAGCRCANPNQTYMPCGVCS